MAEVVRSIVFPEQTGLLLAAEGVAGRGLIVMIIGPEVAVAGLAHPELDVIIHVMTCPFVIADDVNVGLFVPALDPSTCH
jgi:hypothetical protein